MATTRLKISGMTCNHCVMAVTKALRSQPGVRDARVQLQPGGAEVEYDEAQVAPEQMIAAVQEEGYTAEVAGGAVGAP